MLRQDHLTEAVRSMLSTADVPNFTLVSLEPQLKEGGLFVRYKYQDLDDDGTAVKTIEEQLRTTLADRGGIPSWANLGRSEVWAVKGIPWREVRTSRSGRGSPLIATRSGPETIPNTCSQSLIRWSGHPRRTTLRPFQSTSPRAALAFNFQV